MDTTKFLNACNRVLDSGRLSQGIGTLGEKSVHAVLKEYFDPRFDRHEVPVGPYVADVCNEQGFFEIQTRDFARLREKLAYFLDRAPVTVVFPVAAVKWVIWLDEDGTALPRHRTPRKLNARAILPELYKIKPLLGREGLRFCVMVMEVEDYRLRDGRGEDRKKGATKFDRIPVALLEEVWLEIPSDFLKLVPEELPETFTAKEFSKVGKLSLSGTRAGLNVLHHMGVLERVGKQGNAYIYKRAEGLNDPD